MHYRINEENKLGGGKWGRVYLAHNMASNHRLACKSFLYEPPINRRKSSMMRGYAARLKQSDNNKAKGKQEKVNRPEVLNEIHVMNQLEHNNIIKLYEAFEENNKGAHLLMEQ